MSTYLVPLCVNPYQEIGSKHNQMTWNFDKLTQLPARQKASQLKQLSQRDRVHSLNLVSIIIDMSSSNCQVQEFRDVTRQFPFHLVTPSYFFMLVPWIWSSLYPFLLLVSRLKYSEAASTQSSSLQDTYSWYTTRFSILFSLFNSFLSLTSTICS